MNKDRFFASNFIAFVTHTIVRIFSLMFAFLSIFPKTQPLDLIKVRSQMLQEGKTFNGLSFQRGYNPFQLFEEIHSQGRGIRQFYIGYHLRVVTYRVSKGQEKADAFLALKSFDAFLIRTFTYNTLRVAGFCYFYDWINPDPRSNLVFTYFFTRKCSY